MLDRVGPRLGQQPVEEGLRLRGVLRLIGLRSVVGLRLELIVLGVELAAGVALLAGERADVGLLIGARGIDGAGDLGAGTGAGLRRFAGELGACAIQVIGGLPGGLLDLLAGELRLALQPGSGVATGLREVLADFGSGAVHVGAGLRAGRG
jgi:hypothetical protein